MKNIAEQIAEGLDRFYKAFQRKRVLKSLEEISATTNEDDLASATAVAALNNKLANGRVEIIANDDTSLGYKLDGADTVYPFTKTLTGTFKINSAGSYVSISGLKAYKKLSVSASSFTQVGTTNLVISGDGTSLGVINTVTTKTFDISRYDSIRLFGQTTGGDAYSCFVIGSYTIS